MSTQSIVDGLLRADENVDLFAHSTDSKAYFRSEYPAAHSDGKPTVYHLAIHDDGLIQASFEESRSTLDRTERRDFDPSRHLGLHGTWTRPQEHVLAISNRISAHVPRTDPDVGLMASAFWKGVDAIEAKLKDAYDRCVAPMVAPEVSRTLAALGSTGDFRWDLYDRIRLSKDNERLCAFLLRNLFVGTAVLSSETGWDMVRAGEPDRVAFEAAKAELGNRPGRAGKSDAIHGWTGALFDRAAGVPIPRMPLTPVEMAGWLPQIPLDWFPQPRDFMAFHEVAAMHGATDSDIRFGERGLAAAIPGCGGDWTAYSIRLQGKLGKHRHAFMKTRRHFFQKEGMLAEASHAFLKDLMLPLALASPEMPGLSAHVREGLKGRAKRGRIDAFAASVMTRDMDLPSRCSLWVRFAEAKAGIEEARSRNASPTATRHCVVNCANLGSEHADFVAFENITLRYVSRATPWNRSGKECPDFVVADDRIVETGFRSEDAPGREPLPGVVGLHLLLESSIYEGAMEIVLDVHKEDDPTDVVAALKRRFDASDEGLGDAVLETFDLLDEYRLRPADPKFRSGFHPEVATNKDAIAAMFEAWKSVLPQRYRLAGPSGMGALLEAEFAAFPAMPTPSRPATQGTAAA